MKPDLDWNSISLEGDMALAHRLRDRAGVLRTEPLFGVSGKAAHPLRGWHGKATWLILALIILNEIRGLAVVATILRGMV